MKVSVIIPVYNAENFLARALESVINQVYKNLEIIIIDDASTDNTKSIISQYAKHDERIIPFYQSENKGVSFSRNIGLKAATGDYVIFVDSDDELTKEAIRRMIDVADKYNADFIDSYHLLYYKKENGKLVSFTEKKLPKETMCYGKITNNVKALNMYTYITGKLIKRELVSDLTFDESLSRYEDLLFEYELKKKIKNYCFMHKPIYIYYQREDSLINTLGKKHLCYIDAIKKIKKAYSNEKKEVKEELESILFTNAVLTLFTKAIKNDDSILDNTNLVSDALDKLILIFPDYNQNPKIKKILKKKVNTYLNDRKKLNKAIKKMKKKDFIKLYFNILSKINKYELKDPLA